MLVFWRARIALLAVPKTGTTALEAALGPSADVILRHPQHLKHMSVIRYRSEFERFLCGQGRARLDVVAVMREPVDWLGSWYRYRQRAAIAGTDRSTRDMDFDAFVTAWLRDDPAPFARVGRQSRFLAPPEGMTGVDHLFRYDRLEALTDFLEARLETSVDLPRLNVSPDASNMALPPDTKDLLRREAAAEFELWDRLCAGTHAA